MYAHVIASDVREQEYYGKTVLNGPGYGLSDVILQKLLNRGLLKKRKKQRQGLSASDFEDDEIRGDDELCFVFVGVLLVDNCIIRSWPKYLSHSSVGDMKILARILRVIKEYNARTNNRIDTFYTDAFSGEDFPGGNSSPLDICCFLMEDYYENGIYSNTQYIIEHNGDGDVFWDRTISSSWSAIADGRPVYLDLITRRKASNDSDYFKRLHECILTTISKEMADNRLLEVFGYPEISLSEEDISDFGDTDYIEDRIVKELHYQFSTWKQNLLKVMRAYLNNDRKLFDEHMFFLYGTRHYELVWQDVCSRIFGNQLNMRLDDLPVELSTDYMNRKGEKLKFLIEKPYWSASAQCATETLEPDIIRIENGCFYILDAKYYTPEFNEGEPPSDQPGVGDVTKQYLYQLAYGSFIRSHGIEKVVNCFLLPSDGSEFISRGYVSMKMLNDLNLSNIDVCYVPADKAYDMYLSNQMMNVGKLPLPASVTEG